jgi:hypothetical protein
MVKYVRPYWKKQVMNSGRAILAGVQGALEKQCRRQSAAAQATNDRHGWLLTIRPRLPTAMLFGRARSGWPTRLVFSV